MEQLMSRNDAHPLARREARGGFTLLEVLIAFTIFSLGMLTVATMNLHAMQGAKSGRDQSQAAAIAHTQMERLLRLTWTQVPPTGWTAPVTRNVTVLSDPNHNEQSYQVSWRITDVVADLRRSIDVRVDWEDRDRPGRRVTLSSMRFNWEGV
jgi:prepilin-type N-terminal cleavage/methylation domain-containing protein